MGLIGGILGLILLGLIFGPLLLAQIRRDFWGHY